MQEPNLRDVFSASWKLTTRHKGLWILGLFAGLFGQLGILDLVISVAKGASFDQSFGLSRQMLLIFSPKTLWEVGHSMNLAFDSWIAYAWLLVILFGICIACAIVAAISQGGIVHATGLSMEHGLKSVEKFGESWHAGAKHFPEVLILNIVRKCIVFGVSLMVSLVALIAIIKSSPGTTLFFVLSVLFALVVGMIISMLTIFAVCYLVLEKHTLFGAIGRAWSLFAKHWLVSFEVGIILILLNFVLFILLFIGLYIFVAPSLALAAYASLVGNASLASVGISTGILLFLIYATIMGSLFTVFVTSAWTYLFSIMHHWGFKSRIHAWFSRHKRS